MNHFLGFSTSAEQLTRLTRHAIAVSLSLGLTALSGYGMLEATDNRSGSVEADVPEKTIAIPPIPPLTARQALALFEELADNKAIPFEQSYNCFARAERMRQLIESKHLQVMKVWAFKNGDHKMYFQEPLSQAAPVNWQYHVAVALTAIDPNGQKDVYVFDPTIFNAPVRISEWVMKLNTNVNSVDLTRPDIIPERLEEIARVKLRYTRQAYHDIIFKEFKNYRNQGTVRYVYPAKLRDELCANEHDANACKTRGVTWRTVIPASTTKSTPGYWFQLSLQ